MRLFIVGLAALVSPSLLSSQAPGRWPPDSLIMPLERFDFAKDEKRTKLVARQMMRMVQEINRRLDTIPGRTTAGLQVSCATCHRGVSRPLPLPTLVADAALAAGADSAIRALGRAGKYAEAFALLTLNEEMFPHSSGTYVFRANINLMKGDTTAAVAVLREAVRRDPSNGEARGRLQALGRQPR